MKEKGFFKYKLAEIHQTLQLAEHFGMMNAGHRSRLIRDYGKTCIIDIVRDGDVVGGMILNIGPEEGELDTSRRETSIFT